MTSSVLLVEDNADDREMIQRYFQKTLKGHPIDIAKDGAEALEYLYKQKETFQIPNVVLLDLKLPKKNGFEVLEAIRRLFKAKYPPVIVFTSSDDTKDVEKAYRLGANSFIRKPDTAQEFQNALQKIMKYWMNLNEVPEPSYRLLRPDESDN